MIEELWDIIQRSLQKCPWLEKQSLYDLLQALSSEIEEIKKALDEKDLDNLEEEIGDLIYDAFLVGVVAKRDYGINLDNSIKRVVKKISHRKPWLFWERRISLEEAEKIWRERKKKV
ncbi:MazG nucleotide pyrophosphohydrolase domain-containing protein [Thermotoga sp. KOL6]|uniref:MazG nucleotide pyrophosphohydrolase domain-containing protein n=1 Tax=Thermotoga sp. KOL6 TaxID=126741 RepID=UPI000C78A0F6|nr:MazG nucleotide pyrophosphohydrolase domain-containing protein [Thermotoga sp. KOL6]PLV59097.1 nucleotide pyrophosphohydrolase [Thermotoga sp. KOL6]